MNKDISLNLLRKNPAALPSEPGVYMFVNQGGEILYVGKAVNLRARLRQYLSGREAEGRGARIVKLLEESVKVRWRQTVDALEALILEAELIKKHQPPYNVQAKDDKSFSYFLITKEEFPRVLILRATDFDKEKYRADVYRRGKKFGPYASRAQTVAALKILRKIFPFHDRAEKSEKGCLAYQIGLCPGPYAGKISPAEYARNIRGIEMILSGRRRRLISSLRRRMEECSRRQEFEEAALWRDRAAALEHIRDVALLQKDFDSAFETNVDTQRVECFDVSHLGGSFPVAAMAVAVGGKLCPSEYRKFVVRSSDLSAGDDLSALRQILVRRAGHWQDWGVPEMIVLDGGQTHLSMAEELWRSLKVAIPLLAVAKGRTRRKLDIFISRRFPPPRALAENKRLLETLREEAHRLAINFHRRRRDRGLLD